MLVSSTKFRIPIDSMLEKGPYKNIKRKIVFIIVNRSGIHICNSIRRFSFCYIFILLVFYMSMCLKEMSQCGW